VVVELVLSNETVVARRMVTDDGGEPFVEMVGRLMLGQNGILGIEELRVLSAPSSA
jgi:hypothetical protein